VTYISAMPKRSPRIKLFEWRVTQLRATPARLIGYFEGEGFAVGTALPRSSFVIAALATTSAPLRDQGHGIDLDPEIRLRKTSDSNGRRWDGPGVIPRAHASHRDQIIHVREVDGHFEHVGKIRPEYCKRGLNVLADQFGLLFDCAIDALASRGMTGRNTREVGDIAHTGASSPTARRIVVQELDTGRAGRKSARNPSRCRRCLGSRWSDERRCSGDRGKALKDEFASRRGNQHVGLLLLEYWPEGRRRAA
jgi:hypothetical protein